MTIEEVAKYSAIRIIDWCFKSETEQIEEDDNFPSHEIERCIRHRRQMDLSRLRAVLDGLMIETKDKEIIMNVMKEE